MNNELIISGQKKRKVFLQSGFYDSLPDSSNFHKHNYAEVHIIAGGGVDFTIGGVSYSLKSGSIMLIPGGAFHNYISISDNVKHTAFQLDCKLGSVLVQNINPCIILEFLKEIEECKATGSYTKISAYISLFCSYLQLDENVSAVSANDYGFLIREFFSIRYNEDLHLSDLASYLHLSERQCERLVIKHTGRAFREELVSTRMNIAKELLKSSDMPLAEICRHVGYKSYAGFWKAMKKYDILPPNI